MRIASVMCVSSDPSDVIVFWIMLCLLWRFSRIWEFILEYPMRIIIRIIHRKRSEAFFQQKEQAEERFQKEEFREEEKEEEQKEQKEGEERNVNCVMN